MNSLTAQGLLPEHSVSEDLFANAYRTSRGQISILERFNATYANVQHIHDQIEDLKRNGALLQSQLTAKNEHIARLQGEVDRLQRSIDDQTKELKRNASRTAKLDTKIQTLQQQLTASKATIKRLEQQANASTSKQSGQTYNHQDDEHSRPGPNEQDNTGEPPYN
ncbi:hypothetical protein LTR78_010193 [Recurvomyces mirabilis]|uniref:Uncharacterized protein n=1 Tax=Recurvomyces mirabilis TaxID=574656 RepID=A0AAE0TQI7_9PEZI|nr:hypothetical protein LTR78_010193 [Recurvomyces mirabilis]KAK5149722.1 hypothetical protein LTS14_010720 [Recurvomyces mirabilis]